MANVEDDNTPAPSGGVIIATPEREKRGDRGGMKTLVRDDDDQIDPADSAAIERLAKQTAKLGRDRFGHAIGDFYLTNPIARASAIMASLSALHTSPDKATGTDG